MLGKLMKYDIKSSYREFLGIALAAILVSLLLGLGDMQKFEFLGFLAPILVFAVMVASVVLIFTNVFRLYHTAIYGQQGYLTMTLPATTSQVVGAKLIVTSLWILFIGFLCFVSFGLVLLLITKGEIFTELVKIWDTLIPYLTNSFPYAFLLATVVGIVDMVLAIYLSISVAQLAVFRKFRISVGIVFFFLLNWLEGLCIEPFSGWMNFAINVENLPDLLSSLTPYLLILTLISAVLGIIKFFVITYLLKRHLEME